MPPKSKFTREQVIETALTIVREKGEEALTARTLGKYLGSSSCPIFSLFRNMEEVQNEILHSAKEIYNGYIKSGLEQDIPFKGVGEYYIKFAKEEPKLFRLLFMAEQNDGSDIAKVLPAVDDNYEEILQSVISQYGVEKETGQRLYSHLWIYTHGIATLINTGTCNFTDEEIGKMMTDVFIGLLLKIKAGK